MEHTIEEKYLAVFDPDSGSIKSIGPYNVLKTQKYTIDIDKDLAQRIHTGEVKIHSCFLDIESGSVEVAETKNISKIDDVLHRISLVEWSDVENPDVVVEFDRINSTLRIQLNEKWGGKYPYNNKNEFFKPRNMVWSGDTMLEFLITKPNDPNVIYEYFTCYLENIKNNFEFKLTNSEKEFSIYTKRILENYVMEVK